MLEASQSVDNQRDNQRLWENRDELPKGHYDAPDVVRGEVIKHRTKSVSAIVAKLVDELEQQTQRKRQRPPVGVPPLSVLAAEEHKGDHPCFCFCDCPDTMELFVQHGARN